MAREAGAIFSLKGILLERQYYFNIMICVLFCLFLAGTCRLLHCERAGCAFKRWRCLCAGCAGKEVALHRGGWQEKAGAGLATT